MSNFDTTCALFVTRYRLLKDVNRWFSALKRREGLLPLPLRKAKAASHKLAAFVFYNKLNDL